MIKYAFIAALLMSSSFCADSIVRFENFQRPAAASSSEEKPQSWGQWGMSLAESVWQRAKGNKPERTEQEILSSSSNVNPKKIITAFMDSPPCLNKASFAGILELDLETTNTPFFTAGADLKGAFVDFYAGRTKLQTRVMHYEVSHEINSLAVGITAATVCLAPWSVLFLGTTGFAGYTLYKSGQTSEFLTKDTQRIKKALLEYKKTIGLGARVSTFMHEDTLIRPVYSDRGDRVIYDTTFPNPLMPLLSVHLRLELQITGQL